MGSAQLTGSCQCFATSWLPLLELAEPQRQLSQTTSEKTNKRLKPRLSVPVNPVWVHFLILENPSRQLDSEEAAREDDVAGAGLPAGDDEQARAGGVGEEQGGGDDGCHQRIKGFVPKRQQLL